MVGMGSTGGGGVYRWCRWWGLLVQVQVVVQVALVTEQETQDTASPSKNLAKELSKGRKALLGLRRGRQPLLLLEVVSVSATRCPTRHFISMVS